MSSHKNDPIPSALRRADRLARLARPTSRFPKMAALERLLDEAAGDIRGLAQNLVLDRRAYVRDLELLAAGEMGVQEAIDRWSTGEQ